MVKIPVGQRVIVDLWQTKKKRGMVKKFDQTMDLVPAESEFMLHKGDKALVIKSYDTYVLVIPEDKFSRAIENQSKYNINLQKLAMIIEDILKEWIDLTGGILSINEVYSKLMETSLKYVLKLSHLKKISKIEKNFHLIKYDGIQYFSLKSALLHKDIQNVLSLFDKYPSIDEEIIRNELNYSILRTKRILEHLENIRKLKVINSYRKGKEYYLN